MSTTYANISIFDKANRIGVIQNIHKPSSLLLNKYTFQNPRILICERFVLSRNYYPLINDEYLKDIFLGRITFNIQVSTSTPGRSSPVLTETFIGCILLPGSLKVYKVNQLQLIETTLIKYSSVI